MLDFLGPVANLANSLIGFVGQTPEQKAQDHLTQEQIEANKTIQLGSIQSDVTQSNNLVKIAIIGAFGLGLVVVGIIVISVWGNNKTNLSVKV